MPPNSPNSKPDNHNRAPEFLDLINEDTKERTIKLKENVSSDQYSSYMNDVANKNLMTNDLEYMTQSCY